MDQMVLYNISVWALPVLFAITLHEAAHGYAAFKLGDPTAYVLGRISLNPLRHVDFFGTILVPLFLAFTHSPFLFGWAKPVPVDARKFKKPREQMALVAIAGPGVNIILAIISALMMRVLHVMDGAFANWLMINFKNSLIINVILAVFNMLPILPLDGGRVINGLLPRELANRYEQTESYGFFLVIFLLLILPMIGGAMGLNLNFVGAYIQTVSAFIIDLIAILTGQS